MASAALDEVISMEVTKVGRNMRRYQCKVGVKASLETVWDVMTDYERVPEFNPTIADSKIVDRKDKLCQISRLKLPLWLKFDAKMIVDCYEKDVETLTFGKKRDLEFKMIEGDLQAFEGKWSVEQMNNKERGEEFETTFSYMADLKTKIWCPVNLVEPVICSSIKETTLSVVQEAQDYLGMHYDTI